MQKKNIALIGAGIALVGIAGSALLSHAITQNLVKVALHREEPKTIQQLKDILTRSPKTRALMDAIRESSVTLEAAGAEEVEITSRDGERLVGHWYPAENPRRVIVAMHGWRSSWSRDFGMIADFWHQNGCSVLFAEQRGQNNSSGEYMTFGLMERYDCARWIEWVNARTDGRLPVYLAGISMGASTVLLASELNLPHNVHGIIADCGFTSPHDIWRHVVKNNLHLSYGMRGRTISQIYYKKFQETIDDISTLRALEVNEKPVLFIHGSADKFVPIEMTYENYRACRAEKRLLVVPFARHGASYHVDPVAYERTVLDFFADFDEPKKV